MGLAACFIGKGSEKANVAGPNRMREPDRRSRFLIRQCDSAFNKRATSDLFPAWLASVLTEQLVPWSSILSDIEQHGLNSSDGYQIH